LDKDKDLLEDMAFLEGVKNNLIVSFGEWEKNPRLFPVGRDLRHKDWRTSSLGFDPRSGIFASLRLAKTLV